MAESGKPNKPKGLKVFLGPSVRVSMSTNPKPTPKADASLSIKPSNAAVVPEDHRPGPMPTAAAIPARVGMFQRRVPGAAAAGLDRAPPPPPPPPPAFPGDRPLAAAPSFEERLEASAQATLAPGRAAEAFLAPRDRDVRRRRAFEEIKRDITEPIAKLLLELKGELDAMKESGQDLDTKEGITLDTKDGTTKVTFEFSDFTIPEDKLQTLDPLFETLKIRQGSFTGKGDLDTDTALKRDLATLKKLMDFAKTYLENKEEIEAKQKQKDLQLLLTPEIVNTLKQLKETWTEMTEGYSEPTSYEPTVVGDRYTHVFEDGNRFPLTEKQLEDLDLFFMSLEIRPDRISGTGKFHVEGTPFFKDLKTLNELFALIEKPLKPVAAPAKAKEAEGAVVTTLKGSEFEELATAIESEMNKNPYEVTDTSAYTPETYGDERQPKISKGFVSPRVRAFSFFIKDKFKPYELPDIPEDAWDFDACAKMTSKGGDTAEMYAYQKFVRDYMSFMTPYRGVLVYHGLGSGKTCTAIAAAEALFATKAKRRIIVMTPGSLRKNFIQQITFCGFRHFRLQNHWIAYPYVAKEQNALRLFATSVLKIPQAYLDRKDTKTIWIPDFSKEANYDGLTGLEQLQIREQINNTLIYDPHPDPKKRKEGLIWFITYNGVTAKTLKEIACRKESRGEFDTFDNSVIIVDEIHNLIRLMQGVIDPYLTKLPQVTRKAPFEPIGEDKWDPKNCGGTNTYKRGYLFYRLLVEARNSKIIGLSGTPLINFPEELGILANVLHGYNHIYKCVMGLGPDSKKLKADLEAKCKANPYIDYYDVEITTKDIQFRFIFLPEGYTKVPNTLGVVRADAYVPLDAKKASVQEDLKAVLGSVLVPKITVTVEPLLPPFAQYATQLKEGAYDPSFKGAFIAPDEVTVTNRDVLIKRLTGLISYYRGSRKDLMPEVILDEVVRVPMSEYQQQQYARIRVDEIDIEKRKESMTKQAEGAAGLAGRAAEVWAENFEIASLKSSQNYRMASRQACNFVFPAGFTRPRPERGGAKASDELGGNVEDVSEGGEQTALIGTAEEERVRQEEERAEREAAEREEAEIEARLEKDYIDANVAAMRREGKTEAEIETAKEALLAAYRAEREEVVVTGAAEGEAVAGLTPEQKRCRANLLPGETYQTALNRAKECLLTLGKAKLLLKDAEDPEGRPSPLGQVSNKYKVMLENINEIGETKGSSLVYSQFLGMEGIGIFTIAMQANGYDPILLQSTTAPGGLAEYEFTPETVASLRVGAARPRFILFTGSESEQTRKINIDIFNAKLEELPTKIKQVLVETGFTDNKKGQLCRVFCITSAGAEGLSLKNVRSVHIMEPYWNDVRMQQVKGRAVRICSHMDLEYNPDPEKNQRTVEIYSYVSVFDPRAQDADEAPWRIDEEIRMHDSLNEANALAAGVLISRKKKQYVMTSDERLLIISQKKKKVIENLEVCMKAAAADCALNYKENKEDGTFTCRLFSNTGDFLYDPELDKDKKKIGEFEQRDEEREAVFALEQQVRAQQLALAGVDERPPLAPAPTAELGLGGPGARGAVADTLGRAAAALAATSSAAVAAPPPPPPAPIGPKILAYMQGKKKVAVTLTIAGAKKNFWMKPGPDETNPTHYDLFEVVPGTKAGLSGVGKKLGEIRADPTTGKPSGPPQLSS
jgi:hypothetical protein